MLSQLCWLYLEFRQVHQRFTTPLPVKQHDLCVEFPVLWGSLIWSVLELNQTNYFILFGCSIQDQGVHFQPSSCSEYIRMLIVHGLSLEYRIRYYPQNSIRSIQHCFLRIKIHDHWCILANGLKITIGTQSAVEQQTYDYIHNFGYAEQWPSQKINEWNVFWHSQKLADGIWWERVGIRLATSQCVLQYYARGTKNYKCFSGERHGRGFSFFDMHMQLFGGLPLLQWWLAVFELHAQTKTAQCE